MKRYLVRPVAGFSGHLLWMIALAVLVTGCSPVTTSLGNPEDLLKGSFAGIATKAQAENELVRYASAGIEAIKRADYEKASRDFESGLRLDPGHGQLHFLNGLTYHMRSLSGDSAMLELAETGYALALRFDPSNHWAAYFLGHLYFSQQRYLDAQNQFSYGLLYAPGQPNLLHGLAVASYYAKDLQTGWWAAEQAYQAEPTQPDILRTAIFMRAASGDINGARQGVNHLQTNAQDGLNPFAMKTISNRVNDWQKVHERLPLLAKVDTSKHPSVFGTSSGPEGQLLNLDDDGDSFSGYEAADDTSVSAPASPVADKDSGSAPNDKAPVTPKIHLPKMALIDVVIIRTEESRSQARGINLLSALQMTLGGEITGNMAWGKGSAPDSLTLAPTLSFPTLSYNLNIFNDDKNKVEVLARPSLLAVENKTSKFYSGSSLHVQLSSNNSDGSLIDIPIGINLSVTPTFLDDKTVQLVVHAERKILEPQSEKAGFTAFSQTSDTSVDATAVMKIDQTLILSGLSENENTAVMDGVPLLQHIPGLQYFFSHQEKAQTKNSVLILLTPRKAQLLDDEMTAQEAQEIAKRQKQQTAHVSALREEEKIPSNSNLHAVLKTLERNHFYRSFRTGDLNLDEWYSPDTLAGAIARTVEFLYYY